MTRFRSLRMASATKNSARLNFRLPADLKSVIEEAAAATGQTVSDFAISTLLQGSRSVLQQCHITQLSARDRDKFMTLLDAVESKPNRALLNAAREYKKRIRQHDAR
jgi:uncharacterized protein (DUF1778 family)